MNSTIFGGNFESQNLILALFKLFGVRFTSHELPKSLYSVYTFEWNHSTLLGRLFFLNDETTSTDRIMNNNTFWWDFVSLNLILALFK